MNAISYRKFHVRSSIIQRAIWLYARFNLSLRDVEELMAERGVEVSYETCPCYKLCPPQKPLDSRPLSVDPSYAYGQLL